MSACRQTSPTSLLLPDISSFALYGVHLHHCTVHEHCVRERGRPSIEKQNKNVYYLFVRLLGLATVMSL